jgi:hypothetical protein
MRRSEFITLDGEPTRYRKARNTIRRITLTIELLAGSYSYTQ